RLQALTGESKHERRGGFLSVGRNRHSHALWVDGSRYVGLPNLQRLLRQDDRRGRTTAGSTESADRRTGGASEDGSREDARAGRSRESEGRSAGEQDHRRWTEGQRGISAVPVDHG